MTLFHPCRGRASTLLPTLLAAAAIVSQATVVHAQSATLDADLFLGNVVDVNGNPPTDPNAPLYRAGTSPLTPLTRTDGDLVTLDDYDDVVGEISIAARPGGGTDVTVELQGLMPGELYSAWAGYWQEPGFPSGPRIAFGAITEMGDGSDNYATADSSGALTLNLVQQAGPMTVQGNAASYAPQTPIMDDNGVLQPHDGYSVGIAFHFGDYPPPPFLGPGDPSFWALAATATFEPIPEPSAVVLAGIPVVALTCLSRRSRLRLSRV